MASKKFSRLSIMLEARDRMSGPLQKAANSSEKLSSRIRSLSNTLSKSKNSTTAAAQNTRILSEKYKELGHRIGMTQEKAKGFSKVFNTMPNSVKRAASSIETYSQSLEKMLNKTKVGRMAVKSLSSTFQATKSAAESFKNSMGGVGKSVANIAGKFGITSAAIDKTKGKLQSGYLAFNLWKNASPIVDKVTNSFQKLGNALGRPFSKLKNDINQVNSGLSKLSGRRSTFNQLADANARLNKELSKMNSQLARANSRLGSMKSNIGSINGMGAAFGAAYAGQAAYGAAESGVTSTVGKAMEQQYSSASVGILAGAENGAKFYNQIQEYAASTAYSTEDWARNMRGAISKSKSIEDLKVYQQAIEQLATLDPVQGLDGAALAIRELNSGDIVSLVERFELPRQKLKEIKGIEDPIEQMGELMKIVGKETGYTVDAIAKMKELPLMQWQKMTNSMKTALGYMGVGMLEVLSPLIEKFNQLWDSGAFKGFIADMSEGLGTALQKVIAFGKAIYETFQSEGFQEKMAPFVNLFNNIKNTMSEAWPTIKGIIDNLVTTFGGFATIINDNWPLMNSTIQLVFDTVKKLTDKIAEWDGFPAIVMAAAAAWGSFVILSTITPLIMGAYTAIKLLRNGMLLATAAQWALNFAMTANPIGLVIAAIAALIGIGVLLYLHWDIVKAKCVELWDKFGILLIAIGALTGPIGTVIAAGVALIANWDAVKAGAISAWDAIANAFISGANKAIEGVNMLISAINKIPGVDVGTVGKFKAYNPHANKKVSTIRQMPKLPQAGGTGGTGLKAFGMGHHGGLDRVPYDGYEARLHKGERVQTRSEVKAEEKSPKGVTITGNNFYVREEADIDKVASQLFRKLYEAKTAMG